MACLHPPFYCSDLGEQGKRGNIFAGPITLIMPQMAGSVDSTAGGLPDDQAAFT